MIFKKKKFLKNFPLTRKAWKIEYTRRQTANKIFKKFEFSKLAETSEFSKRETLRDENNLKVFSQKQNNTVDR